MPNEISGLLGPTGAMQRLQELQSRIDAFSGPSVTSGSAGFDQALKGAIGGSGPVDPRTLGFVPQDLSGMADTAASKYGLDPKIFQSLVQTESGWDPNAKSNKGAMGLAQLMPDTAAGLGVSNPFDPGQNLEGGAKYLKQMLDRFGGDYTKALAAYNAGPGAVEKSGGVPPYQETIAYIRKILGGAKG